MWKILIIWSHTFSSPNFWFDINCVLKKTHAWCGLNLITLAVFDPSYIKNGSNIKSGSNMNNGKGTDFSRGVRASSFTSACAAAHSQWPRWCAGSRPKTDLWTQTPSPSIPVHARPVRLWLPHVLRMGRRLYHSDHWESVCIMLGDALLHGIERKSGFLLTIPRNLSYKVLAAILFV